MMTAQVILTDGLNEPTGVCELKINGTVAANTSTGWVLKSGTGNLTIVSAATLTATGSFIEVDCLSGDTTTVAGVNLALVTVDALN
jgi:hypothetical protein